MESQREATANTQAASQDNDNLLAERLVRTLKGVAGNIGASTIQSKAGEIEALIHARSLEENSQERNSLAEAGFAKKIVREKIHAFG